jgi:predicted transcriptional regulator
VEQTNLRREKSRNKILFALKEGSKRFVDLKRETGLSPRGLNDIRKILLEEGLIQQDNSKAYELTEKGKESSVNASQFNAKTEIKIDLNYSIWDYSTMNGGLSALSLPWGISSELIRDKKINHSEILSQKDVGEIEELMFKKMVMNKVNEKYFDKRNKKMVISFELDLEKVSESIEKQSLEYVENITDEEKNLLAKYEHDPESVTPKEIQRMTILREQTYKKIKK